MRCFGSGGGESGQIRTDDGSGPGDADHAVGQEGPTKKDEDAYECASEC